MLQRGRYRNLVVTDKIGIDCTPIGLIDIIGFPNGDGKYLVSDHGNAKIIAVRNAFLNDDGGQHHGLVVEMIEVNSGRKKRVFSAFMQIGGASDAFRDAPLSRNEGARFIGAVRGDCLRYAQSMAFSSG